MKTENASVADQQAGHDEKQADNSRRTLDEKHSEDQRHAQDKNDGDEGKDSNNLLKHIQSLREEAGGEVTDEEFTRLLREAKLPGKDGFTFLSYCDRFVMFSVPQQEADNWYEEKGWIKKEKLEAAKKIGEKYKFTISQPPDIKNASNDNPNPHHRLQMSNPLEIMVIVHPQFLKIRLYTLASNTSKVERPLKKCELMQDLAQLYGKDGSK